MSEKMQVWQLAEWGKANLKIATLDIPQPGPEEVLVRVRAVSLNYRDKPALDGSVLLNDTPLPYIPCSDVAGEIVATGAKVSRWQAGEKVSVNYWIKWIDGQATTDLFGLSLDLPGTLAEYIVVPESAIVRAPQALSMEEISTLPIAAVTAWTSLITLGQLKAGQSVLLQGTGGVSLFGLQFARMSGAHVIITSRSAEKLERAKALGAHDVIDTSEHPNWAARAREITNGRGVDHIFETIGGENYRQSVEAAAVNGRITAVGFLDKGEFTTDIIPLIIGRITIQGLSVGHRRAFEELVSAININGLKPVIEHVYDWTDAPAAFDHLDRGAFGKIVISVNP